MMAVHYWPNHSISFLTPLKFTESAVSYCSLPSAGWRQKDSFNYVIRWWASILPFLLPIWRKCDVISWCSRKLFYTWDAVSVHWCSSGSSTFSSTSSAIRFTCWIPSYAELATTIRGRQRSRFGFAQWQGIWFFFSFWHLLQSLSNIK